MYNAYITPINLIDCCDMEKWSTHQKPLGFIGKNSTTNNACVLFFWGETQYGSSAYAEKVWSSADVGSGEGKLQIDTVKGIEAFNDRSLVILEGSPEYSIERWKIDPVPEWTGDWAGGQGDDADMFNNPIDVTTDKEENIYVLDKLSTGDAVVKVFNSDFESLGIASESYLITGNPIALDYDEFNGAVHVLHTEGVAVLGDLIK